MRRRLTLTAIALAVIVGGVSAWRWANRPAPAPAAAISAAAVWACPEHRDIRHLEPGRCPLCGRPLELAESPAGSDR